MRTTENQSSRPRDDSGRFEAMNVSRTALGKKLRQDAYNARNLATPKIIFEKLIGAIFLKVSRSDWIPAAASSGPFVAVAENLIKKKYLLSRCLRSQYTRIRYYDGCVSKRQEDIPKMEVREASNPTGQKCRVRVYRGRRFPIVCRQSQEMAVVQEWIRYALEKDSLKVSTYVAAYELLRKTFKTYKTIDGKGMYIGYSIMLQPPQAGPTVASSAVAQRETFAPDIFAYMQSAAQVVQRDFGGIMSTDKSSGTNAVPACRRPSVESIEGQSREDLRQLITHTSRMLDAAKMTAFSTSCAVA